jgi:hypothetical protein
MKKPVAEGSAAGQKKSSARTSKQLLSADQSKLSAAFLVLGGTQGERRILFSSVRGAGMSALLQMTVVAVDAPPTPPTRKTLFAGARRRYERLAWTTMRSAHPRS